MPGEIRFYLDEHVPLAVTENLVACVRRHLPDVKGEVALRRITTGKFNTSYFVETGAGAFVLRVAPAKDTGFLFYERDMMRQEPGIHRLLLEKTTVPVPRIIAYDDSHEIIDRDFLLMERLPGEALSDAPVRNVDRVLAEVGQCLAQAHRLTADRYGYLGEHKPMEPQPTWPEAFRIMWRKLIKDVAGCGHYDQSEAAHLIGLLDAHLPLFDRKVPSSLLHMDVWGQNILVGDGGRLTGLVDWDRALWGDPEIEFAVLDYCGISRPAFWEGYGQRRDESKEAPIRTVFYLLYEIQKYIVIRQLRGRNPEGARSYKRHTFEIVQRFFS